MVAESGDRRSAFDRFDLHARKTEPNPSEPVDHAWVAHLARHLEDNCATGAHERLVVFAPADLLAQLRTALSPSTARLLVTEVTSDLAHADVHEL